MDFLYRIPWLVSLWPFRMLLKHLRNSTRNHELKIKSLICIMLTWVADKWSIRCKRDWVNPADCRKANQSLTKWNYTSERTISAILVSILIIATCDVAVSISWSCCTHSSAERIKSCWNNTTLVKGFLAALKYCIDSNNLLIEWLTQKLFDEEKVPMKTLPEAAPTQNLLPLWFHDASMFALVSLITARVGLRPLISEDSSHTMTPRSVELLNNKFVIGCQSSELIWFKCYKIQNLNNLLL